MNNNFIVQSQSNTNKLFILTLSTWIAVIILMIILLSRKKLVMILMMRRGVNIATSWKITRAIETHSSRCVTQQMSDKISLNGKEECPQ